MILVNSPGNRTSYAWLSHSSWDGCTLADMVFPFFIFIVGVSLVFSLSKSLERQVPPSKLCLSILRRSLIIFSLGLLLNAFPHHFDFSSLRVLGVLQRIALCYLVASLLFLSTSIRTQAIVLIVLLLGYWCLIMFLPVPGFAAPLSQEGNWVGYVDRLLFNAEQLYQKTFDPEGLLSTLPAIATALMGNITGAWLLSQHNQKTKCQGLLLAGGLSLIIAWVWGLSFPFNKALWTSSYVLWTGGLALLLLAACYWLIEIKQWKKWSRPFEIFGLNAIAAYFLHVFFLKVQAMIPMTVDGKVGNLRLFISQSLFGSFSPENASLLYALSYLLLWLLLLTYLYHKKIFIKV